MALFFSDLSSHSGQSGLRPPSVVASKTRPCSAPCCTWGSYASASVVAASLVAPASSRRRRPWPGQRSIHVQQCSPMLVHIDAGGFDCICAGILGRMHMLKTVEGQGRQVRFPVLALLPSMDFGSSNSCSDTAEPRVYE